MSGIVHRFGDVVLESGATLPAAQLTYATHGTLNAARTAAGFHRPAASRSFRKPRFWRCAARIPAR